MRGLEQRQRVVYHGRVTPGGFFIRVAQTGRALDALALSGRALSVFPKQQICCLGHVHARLGKAVEAARLNHLLQLFSS